MVAADLEDSIIRARRQPLPRHRLLQQTLALVAHRAEASYVSRRHLRVREDALAAQALALPKARAHDARANLGGRLARCRFAAQLFEADGGHVNVYVYPVEERAGDATDVALDLQRRAAALARRVVPESARTRIHRGGEHEGGREGERHRGAADSHPLIFERLAQDFENAPVEFRQLVEEEHAVVRERNFAGARYGPAADESGVAYRVVR